MKLVLVLLLSLVLCDEATMRQMFEDYCTEFHKSYATEADKEAHYLIFSANFGTLSHLNESEQAYPEDERVEYGFTQFMDMSEAEFRRRYLHEFEPVNETEHAGDTEYVPEASAAVKKGVKPIDWRSKHVLQPIRNQGQCGSCWAFAAVGAVEGRYKVHCKKSVAISEQFLVDCDRSDHGCQGGWPESAFHALARSRVPSRHSYPYSGRQGACRGQAKKAALKVGNKVLKYQGRSAETVANGLTQGPMATAIYVGGGIQFYKGGVDRGRCCTSGQPNHAMGLVGWAQKGRNKYWIIRNSWGSGWGNHGYYYLSWNSCAAHRYATAPTVSCH